MKTVLMPFLLASSLAMVACTGPGKDGKKDNNPFHAVHLDSQAIPALIAYRDDIGTFPTGSEGWQSLYCCPTEPEKKAKWDGPYLSRYYEEYQGQIALCTMNGRACYDIKNQVVHLNLDCRRLSGKEFSRVITLSALSDVQPESLSKYQRETFGKIAAFCNAMSEYYTAHGSYPEAFNGSEKENKDVTLWLKAFGDTGAIRYCRTPGNRGYYVFFSGHNVHAYRGYYEFDKSGECQLIVTRSGSKEKFFFALGDWAEKE